MTRRKHTIIPFACEDGLQLVCEDFQDHEGEHWEILQPYKDQQILIKWTTTFKV